MVGNGATANLPTTGRRDCAPLPTLPARRVFRAYRSTAFSAQSAERRPDMAEAAGS